MSNLDYIDGEHWSVLMRLFAKDYGLMASIRWIGVGREPWRAEFTTVEGVQMGLGSGKYPATALNRAMHDAERRMERRGLL